ncbi:MAG: GreA/GreB family elongation factor [Psychroflexus sp.]|nr:GreA/GreB family elongation factor [Psychroflexus sp.]MDN6310243.1 GreA/GreB family elongation factor [Psychroflexus sp.]
MSRAFVKEGDQEEQPFIPPRADLPAKAPNYVTPEGLEALKNEKRELIDQRQEVIETQKDAEKRKSLALIEGNLQLLQERLNNARPIDLEKQPQDHIKFGADIKLKLNNKSIQNFQIVGVDEADVMGGKIAFTSPLARLLINKKNGDLVELQLKDRTQKFEVIAFDYSK